MKKTLLLAIVSCSLLLSSIANSAIITANGTAINPLNLTDDYDSFLAFYDYRTSDSSAHTGFEKANRVVVFLTKIKEQLALIITTSGPSGNAGELIANITGTEGGISFIDDPKSTAFADVLSGSTISWAYSPGKSDGLIFSGIYSDNWNIDLSFKKIAGGLAGIDVLTFDTNNQVSTAFSTGISRDSFRNFAIATNIPANATPPGNTTITVSTANTTGLFAVFGLALVYFRFRTKR